MMSHKDSNTAGRHHALNWLFDGLAEAVVPNSCDLVVLDGHLDRERLRAAIASTLARHPVLCRPLGKAPSDAAPPAIDLRFQVLADDDPARLDDHLLGLIWDEPFAPSSRPVRFLVTETPTRTYLQTIHTHVYADASACYALTEQLAASYAQPHVTAPAQETHRQAADLFATVPSLGERLRHHAHGLLQTARDLFRAPAGLAVRSRRAAGRRRLSRICLSKAQTEQLRATARGRGHSIHAFFQLAFLRAAADFNQRRGVERSALRIWDFFSLRPLLEQGSTRYDCLALIYPIDLDAAWSDDETLARCTDNVSRMRSRDLLTHASRFESLRRLVPRQKLMRVWPSLFKSNVFVTNPGVCPSPLLSFGDVEVLDYVTFPQLFFPADVLFVFSTFRDRLRILVLHDEAAFDPTFADELLAPFLRKLSELGKVELSPQDLLPGFVASWLPLPQSQPARNPSFKRSA